MMSPRGSICRQSTAGRRAYKQRFFGEYLRVFHKSMRSIGETSGLDVPVARGPVPRDRWAPFCRSRSSEALACLPSDLDPFGIRRSRTTVFYRVRAWRGTGPRPTGRGAFFHRSAGACPPRAPSSRCVSPSVVCDRLITNGSDLAILPYRAWHANDGEGQALALR